MNVHHRCLTDPKYVSATNTQNCTKVNLKAGHAVLECLRDKLFPLLLILLKVYPSIAIYKQLLFIYMGHFSGTLTIHRPHSLIPFPTTHKH